jgi:tRNA(fMet)-specific endonuclease VapC
MICLDSSFIIDFLNKDTKARVIYEKYSNEEFFISEITIFEVATGFLYSEYKHKKSNFDIFIDFISNFQILSTLNLHSFEAARISASLIYKGKRIDDNDCIIAGTMIANNVKKIITKNKKHFSKIKGIEVLSY